MARETKAMDRRVFLAGAIAICAPIGLAQAQTSAPPAPTGPFTLPALPYAISALEPVIDTRTMELHHGRHHKAFIDNLNRAVASTPALSGLSVEQILRRVSTFTPAIRNNAGGHWNHAFFWETMQAPTIASAPSPELLTAINASFGSLEGFKTAFNAAGMGRFGSGWVWLIVQGDGKLAITTTPNQDNPLMDSAETRGMPILGNDLWEHAYYLNYQNRRADYLAAWWRVVNWTKVSQRFAAVQPVTIAPTRRP
jgi:superoxide dismutase, Fe-Mn family